MYARSLWRDQHLARDFGDAANHRYQVGCESEMPDHIIVTCASDAGASPPTAAALMAEHIRRQRDRGSPMAAEIYRLIAPQRQLHDALHLLAIGNATCGH